MRASIVVAIVLGLVSFAEGQEPPFVEKPGDMEFSGRMIARLAQPDAGVAASRLDLEVRRHRAMTALRSYELIRTKAATEMTVFRIEPGTENQVARELLATGGFEYVEPDWRVFPVGCPNDPRLGSQWHHDASKMNSCSGWDLHTGNPTTVVGVCDTGIRTTHEDFQLHRQEGYNAVDRIWESQGGDIGPINPHGTYTSGAAAANGNNGLGVVGVGWDLGHRMLRVSNDSSGSAFTSDILHGAETSIENGDNVASVSYSGVSSSSNRSTATYIKSIGGLLVWAAGNDSADLKWGHRDADDIIVVGASDSGDNRSGFSAFGRAVDVFAPGSGIHTTDSGHDSDYTSVSGTSLSCPLAAGLCALIWSSQPDLTPDEVERALKAGCDDLGTTGEDDTFGYGRIEVLRSLRVAANLAADVGILLSLQDDGVVGGVSADNDDILLLDQATATYSMYFDASDVLTETNNLDAFTVLDDGSILVSFKDDGMSISGLTGGPNGSLIDDEDLIQFFPTTLGDDTSGTFVFYFDGSDVGLDATKEDISAVDVADNGDIHLSTKGPFDVGITGKNEDIIVFTPTALGATTAGTFSLLFDGNSSFARLGKKGEQLDAYVYFDDTGFFVGSTGGDFRTPTNKRGVNDDLILWRAWDWPTQNGTIFIVRRGADFDLTPHDIDGIHILD